MSEVPRIEMRGAPVAAKIYANMEPRIKWLRDMGKVPVLRFGMTDGNTDDSVYRNMLVKKANELGFHVISDISMDRNKSVVARAVMATLDYYYGDVKGNNVCVIGRSEHVGLPIAKALLDAHANVTVCHSKTKTVDLYRYASSSDIIVTATGVQGVLNRCEWEKRVDPKVKYTSPIFVDVGCNFLPNGKMVGDIDPDLLINAMPYSIYTPVPGGIGPVTIAIEMLEALEKCEREAGIKIK